MRKIIFYLLFLVLVSGCNISPEEVFENNDTEAGSTTDSAGVLEDFMPFFEQFKTNPDFQVENVQFPYRVEIWELGADKPEVEKIFKEEWEHLGFQYDSSYAKRQTDAYTQNIKSYGDTVKIELRGVDNGILIDYEFLKKDGQWQLVAEKDYSG